MKLGSSPLFISATSYLFCSKQSMHFQLPPIADLDNAALRARLQHVLDHKTKPLGALGQLEALALRLGLLLGSEQP